MDQSNRWRWKTQERQAGDPRKPPKSPSRGLGGSGEARFPENHHSVEPAEAYADHDTAVIIANLTHDYTGRPLHNLGAEVLAALEYTLPMLRRPARGQVAVEIDNAFMLAHSVKEARRQALAMLSRWAEEACCPNPMRLALMS